MANSVGYYYNLDNPKQVLTKPETGAGAAKPAVPLPPGVSVVVTTPGNTNRSGAAHGVIIPQQPKPTSPQAQQSSNVVAAKDVPGTPQAPKPTIPTNPLNSIQQPPTQQQLFLRQMQQQKAEQQINPQPIQQQGGDIKTFYDPIYNRFVTMAPTVAAARGYLPVDPNTGRPYNTVQPAQTVKQSYQEYIKDKNPISGTVSFIGQKIQGAFGRAEQKYTPNSQSLASTDAVAKAVEVAPYAIPYVDAVYGGAVGVSQFTTKGGIQEIKKQPTALGKAEVIGGAVGNLALAGLGAVKGVEKAAGLPKYESAFVSKPNIRVVEDLTGIKAYGEAKVATQKTGLLSSSKSVSSVKTVSEYKPITDELTKVDSMGLISSANYKTPQTFELTTGDIQKSIGLAEKPKLTAVTSVDIVKQNPVTLSNEVNGIKVSKTFEGYSFFGTKKVIQGEAGKFATSGNYEFKAGGAVGAKVNDKVISLSRNLGIERDIWNTKQIVKVLKQGKETSIGVSQVQEASVLDSDLTGLNFGKSSTGTKTASKVNFETFVKPIEEMRLKDIATASVQTKPQSIKPLLSASSVSNILSQSDYYGKGQYEKTEATISLFPVSNKPQKQIDIPKLNIFGTSTRNNQNSNIKNVDLGSGSSSPSVLNTNTKVDLGTATKTRSGTDQITKLITRQIPKAPNNPETGGSTSFIDIPGLPGWGGGSQGFGSRRKPKKINLKRNKINSKYTASLAAAALEAKPVKVTKKQLDTLDKTVFSGFETRPLLEITDNKKLIKKVKF